MKENRILIGEQDHYLVIPILAEKPKKKIFFIVEDTYFTELNIPMLEEEEVEYQYDYLAFLPISQFQGKEILLKGDYTQNFINSVHTAKHIIKKRQNRPQIHFTPDYGWINDPNGLLYQGGLYHLYFQYNPFDTQWDNMSWGHAISKDLLHWEQIDTVLFPDEDGTIFSGCGIVNEFGLLGLPKDALLFYYSAAGNANELSKGKDFVQKLAYSLDGGNTLTKSLVAVPTICKENRDPKVFYHEPTKAYIMCLWLEGNEFAILRSVDLKKFEISQRLFLDQGFECPDLFELKIEDESGENTQETKWVFWCADGYYYLGNFDGYEFHVEGSKKEAYHTKLPYAAQTISNMDGRVISIPWLRTKTVNKLYTGCMGLPREFNLCRCKGELRLKQSLPKEIRERINIIYSMNSKESKEVNLKWEKESVLGLQLTLKKDQTSKGFHGFILGCEVEYNQENGVIKVGEEQIPIKTPIEELSMIFDSGIIEITANNDIIYAVIQLEQSISNDEINLSSNEISELMIYEVK